jgi:hypothetical protein
MATHTTWLRCTRCGWRSLLYTVHAAADGQYATPPFPKEQVREVIQRHRCPPGVGDPLRGEQERWLLGYREEQPQPFELDHEER